MDPGARIEAHLLLAAIVATSDDAIVSTDLAGTISSWNGAAERMLGYSEQEAIGQSIDLIVPPERCREERDTLQAISSGRQLSPYDTILVGKQGRRVSVSLAVSPVRTASGEVIGSANVARDMSAAQQGERATRHLAAVVDSSDDAIISKDLDGTILSWNTAAERIFGFMADEAIGQSIRLIIPLDRQAEEDDVLRRVRRGEAIDHFETIRRRKDGRMVAISLTVSPIRALTGEVIGASKIARDITTNQRLQRDAFRLAAIVQSSDDAIIGKDLDGIVTSWNGAAEKIFGFSSEEMVGRSIRLLIPADLELEEDEVLARIRSGNRVDHYKTTRLTKDGTRIPVSLTVSPIRDERGTVIGASKIARDIRESQRVEEERQQLLRIAQEASALKDDFLATLSHELRTPLNAIVGYARIMQSGLLTEDRQRRAVETVVRNATLLTQIVEDVLDVSRIIAGKIRLNVQPVELPAVVRDAVESVRPAADAKGLHIDTVLDPRATPVAGDPERLQQIMWNLLSNAVKFTPRGGRVQVGLARVDSQIEISVTDSGIGIPATFLPHVFERFRQAEGSIVREHGGLGLGLAISRHLVEMQGGRIFAASNGPGTGATFRLVLPAMILHDPDAREPGRQPQRPPFTGHLDVPSLQGRVILAVDDDADAVSLLREILESTGATVLTASSGSQVLEHLVHTTPDVLIADVGMPHMSGFELIDQIRRSERQDLRDLPAAALTAYARSEDRAKALRSGFHMHLTKPIDPAELMAAVAALIKPKA